MKAIIILASVSVILAGCAGSGSDDSSNAAPTAVSVQPPHNNPPTPPPTPIDYSTVACYLQSDCAKACAVKFPQLTATQVRSDLCTITAGGPVTTAQCEALVQRNFDTYIKPSSPCVNAKVLDVIKAKSIGATSCANQDGCPKYCADLYKPVTDQSIENSIAAFGGTLLSQLLVNHVTQAALDACLAAPANFVIPLLD